MICDVCETEKRSTRARPDDRIVCERCWKAGTKNPGIWLCYPCGKNFRYLGQIAGTVANSCTECGEMHRTLYKFHPEEPVTPHQERFFINLGEKV